MFCDSVTASLCKVFVSGVTGVKVFCDTLAIVLHKTGVTLSQGNVSILISTI